MKLVIDLGPDDELGKKIIEKAARIRKNRQRQLARQQQTPVAIDDKLSDEEFLVSGIKSALLNDYKDTVKAETALQATKDKDAELNEELKNV